MPRSPRRIFWPVLTVLMLLVIGACGLLGFTTCNPPDLVTVSIKNIPPNMPFLSLAAITDKGPVTMMWASPYPIRIAPSAWHPATHVPHDVTKPELGWQTYWRTGQKYGVVMQTKKGEWKVAWFPASEVPLEGRTVFGGGKATLDLSKAEIVPLDADTVKALGLQDVKPENR